MSDAELAERMKAAGMLSIEEILAGNLMGDFSTHVGVTDIPSLLEWAEKKHEAFLKMRLKYEVGMSEKDDLYEWVFAHSAAFGTIVDHMRKAINSATELEGGK